MLHEWITDYASKYPGLFIFKAAYWRGLGRLQAEIIHVLNRLDDLIEAWMIMAQSLEDVYYIASVKLRFPSEPTLAIYVGSGWKFSWIASILDETALFLDLGALAMLKWINQRDVCFWHLV